MIRVIRISHDNIATLLEVRYDSLTLLHSERPKLYTILAFLSAIRLNIQVFPVTDTLILSIAKPKFLVGLLYSIQLEYKHLVIGQFSYSFVFPYFRLSPSIGKHLVIGQFNGSSDFLCFLLVTIIRQTSHD